MTHLGYAANAASPGFTVFLGATRLLSGSALAVAMAVRKASAPAPAEPLLIFDDATGRTVDFDTRGTDEAVAARFTPATPAYGITRQQQEPEPIDQRLAAQTRGRPKLGVVAREVTLLPRHWEWLNAQPGGASVTLRKLVEDARRHGGTSDKERRRKAQDAAYHFMSAIAGDLPGFEEATRALYAGDAVRFRTLLSAWPADIRDHAERLAAFGPAT